jgi:hypothetical protein
MIRRWESDRYVFPAMSGHALMLSRKGFNVTYSVRVLARRRYGLGLMGMCTNMCRLHTWKIVYVIDATVVEVLVVDFFSFCL